jgi:hypothetical protein
LGVVKSISCPLQLIVIFIEIRFKIFNLQSKKNLTFEKI